MKLKPKDVQLDKTLEEFLRSVNKIRLFKRRCAEDFTEYADDIISAFVWGLDEGKMWGELQDDFDAYKIVINKTNNAPLKYNDIKIDSILYKFLRQYRLVRKFKRNCLTECNPVVSSIANAFNWCDSLEGLDYWMTINTRYTKYLHKHKDHDKNKV